MALEVKNPPAKAGDRRDTGLIPGSGRSPWGGNGNPLQCPCLENPMGRLVGYSPQGHVESDTTEATGACTHKGVFSRPEKWLKLFIKLVQIFSNADTHTHTHTHTHIHEQCWIYIYTD